MGGAILLTGGAVRRGYIIWFALRANSLLARRRFMLVLLACIYKPKVLARYLVRTGLHGDWRQHE